MPKRTVPLIALLTDFGTRDWYVATLKAVILSRCTQARFVDITHDVPPQDIRVGAFTLAAAAPWFPVGTIFLAVVDPGVGSQRTLIAARANGRYFLGPDNGLLSPCLACGSGLRIVRLTHRGHRLPESCRTFQARDVLAPAAAHLACGGLLPDLGSPVQRIVKLETLGVRRRSHEIRGHIVHIDAYGNLVTNLPAVFLREGNRLRTPAVHCRRRKARVVSSYADGQTNELIALADSLDVIELAVRNASAARMLGAKRGDGVRIAV